MMDTWSLIKLRYKRSGLHLTPIGWLLVTIAVVVVLYKFYSMADRRSNTGKVVPAMNEEEIEASVLEAEKKYKKEMAQNIEDAKAAGEEMPQMPIFDRELAPKVHLEHIPKPKVKKFPVDILSKPSVRCPKGRLVLVILVSSAVENYQARNGIRQTWGRQENYKRFKDKDTLWKTVFIVGHDDNADDIRRENELHNDVIQADFFESPQEETRKFMVGVSWVVQNMSPCKPAFLLKVPDHEYVNMPAFLGWMSAKFKTMPRNIYLGKMIRLDQPIRDDTHPLYVSKEDYPPKFFPDLIEGPVYFFSYDVVLKMRPLFGVQIPIAMEDGYIGILMKRLGVRPRHNDRYHKMNFVDFPCQHIFMILVHNIKPMDQLTLFDNINRDIKGGRCKRASRFN